MKIALYVVISLAIFFGAFATFHVASKTKTPVDEIPAFVKANCNPQCLGCDYPVYPCNE